MVAYLKAHPQEMIDIAGHTDNSGPERINKKLSAERAKTVAAYLIANGIDKNRVRHAGYGSSKAIATNDTEDGRRQNRRVEFTLNTPPLVN